MCTSFNNFTGLAKHYSLNSGKTQYYFSSECSDGPGLQADCARRAAAGECESNIAYTYTHCADTCNLCPSEYYRLIGQYLSPVSYTHLTLPTIYSV